MEDKLYWIDYGKAKECDLDDTEILTIEQWKSGYGTELSGKMRFTEGLSEEDLSFIDKLCSALAKLDQYNNGTVWRCDWRIYDPVEKFPPQRIFIPEDAYTEWFRERISKELSYSNLLASYPSRPPEERTYLKIKCSENSNGYNISNILKSNDSELEVLFLPDTHFRITKVEDENTITLLEIDDIEESIDINAHFVENYKTKHF